MFYVSMYLCICLSIYLSIYLYMCVYICIHTSTSRGVVSLSGQSGATNHQPGETGLFPGLGGKFLIPGPPSLQGYLAHKKTSPYQTLEQGLCLGPDGSPRRGVLGTAPVPGIWAVRKKTEMCSDSEAGAY